MDIDGHKLNFHPERISQIINTHDWEQAKKIYPIYMEVSPSGTCNHRCKFCGLDFMNYQKVFLDEKIFCERAVEMGKLGVKSIMFAGEGEPMLHRKMVEMIICTKNAGIDVAFTTNGSVMTESFCEKTINHINWIKISIDAGMPETYEIVHGVNKKQFSLVIRNIGRAIEIRNRKNGKCSIGAQMLFLPENSKEIFILADLIKNSGADYLVIKPYSQHPLSETKVYAGLDYDEFEIPRKEIEKYNNGQFQLICRLNAFSKMEEEKKPYSCCYSVPFLWAYITARGDVYSCSMFLNESKFCLGNIYEQTFQEIWEGEKRRQNWIAMKKFNASLCRKACRMDECNRFLYQLKNPPPHVNFI